MKLELKHLAPYLPYVLKMASNTKGRSAYVITIKRRLKAIEILTPELIDVMLFLNRKPILRPLSDLTKEIEVNGERFVPIDYLSNFTNEHLMFDRTQQVIEYLYIEQSQDYVFQLPYELIQKLIEWHFDIFSLLDNNLAINYYDINK